MILLCTSSLAGPIIIILLAALGFLIYGMIHPYTNSQD